MQIEKSPLGDRPSGFFAYLGDNGSNERFLADVLYQKNAATRESGG